MSSLRQNFCADFQIPQPISKAFNQKQRLLIFNQLVCIPIGELRFQKFDNFSYSKY